MECRANGEVILWTMSPLLSQSLKISNPKMAYGFRNRDHLKTAIYFHCGGLDLYPGTH